jgi:hypothetical protein
MGFPAFLLAGPKAGLEECLVSGNTKRALRYGAIGLICVAVVAGGAYFVFGGSHTENTTASAVKPAAASTASAAQTPARKAKAASDAIDTDDDAAAPSDTQTDQALNLIADARQQAAKGQFPAAQADLDKAEKVIPHMKEIADARRDISQLSTPEGQLKTQLDLARAAAGSDDRVAAGKALAAAEKLNPQAPEIAALRQTLQADEQKDAKRRGRVEGLISSMHQAINRHDIAAADGAFNEAMRVDVRDPSLDQARVELARAHDAQHKQEEAVER